MSHPSSSSVWSGPPVFLIGAARSGTTVLGGLLGEHPDLAYWIEPRYVWRYGNPGRRDDRREPEEATPRIAAHIRKRFEHYTRRAGQTRFLEKTPSNCFRVGFMHAVFPDGLFVHVLRDGRDVAASALGRWRSPPDDGAIWRRIREWEIPVKELHHYLPDIAREALVRRFSRRGVMWGPRFPGMVDAVARGESDVRLCARQWVESMRYASEELRAVPACQVLTLRYEAFVEDPASALSEVFAFANLPPAPAVLEKAAREIRGASVGAYRRLPDAERRVIEAECAPLLDVGAEG